MITGIQALERLREGNQRFVCNRLATNDVACPARRFELATVGQSPFAIVLGCADSRVPAEIVFDQGLGDLFVVRVAGNIVAPSQLASIEFAIEVFATSLIVVLGHTACGAVMATLNQLRLPAHERAPNLRPIVDRVRPAVETVLENLRDSESPDSLLIERAVRANVRSSANQIRRGSENLERRIARDQLLVVGAEYSLETGVVEFFD